MRALVVYDSVFGNTELVAKAIGDGLAEKSEVRLVKASQAGLADIDGIDLLVVGAPTQGGRPTPAVRKFLKSLPSGNLKNVKAATFDTRITKGGTGKFARIFGYAAPRIGSELKRLGATLVHAEGFSVLGKEGPLEEGETARAKEWANRIAG